MGRLGDLSPAASVAVGILVGICSTLIQSLGLTLQRKSHIIEDTKPVQHEGERRPPYRRRKWQLGMLMFIVSNLVGSSIQITTLPLPVLSTLQASGLVFNTVCASLILGEPFTRWSLIGTIMVAGGAVLIALFGALPEPSHTLQQLLDLMARAQFIIWMVGTGCIAVAVLGIAAFLTRLYQRAHHHHQHRLASRYRLWIGMSFGCVSAILSAHSLLVAKSAVELLVRTIIDRSNQFNRAPAWLILVALVILALSQLYFLHRGLKLASTSVLYPFVFCIYNIVAIIDGLIYFNQTSRLPALHAGLIAVGTIVLLSGVLALSWRLGDEDEDDPEKHQQQGVAPEPAHTLLTPGMGLLDDTTTEDETDLQTATPSIIDSEEEDDEESRLEGAEQRPLLQRSASWRSQKRKRTPDYQTITNPLELPGDAHIKLPSPKLAASSSTPAKSKRLTLQMPRLRRPRFSKEVDEIWGELQDSGSPKMDRKSPVNGRSGQHHRSRSDSVFSMPAAIPSDEEDGNSADDEDTDARRTNSVPMPNMRRAKTTDPNLGLTNSQRRRSRWRSISGKRPGSNGTNAGASTDNALKRATTLPTALFGGTDTVIVRQPRRREGSLGGWIMDIWNRGLGKGDGSNEHDEPDSPERHS